LSFAHIIAVFPGLSSGRQGRERGYVFEDLSYQRRAPDLQEYTRRQRAAGHGGRRLKIKQRSEKMKRIFVLLGAMIVLGGYALAADTYQGGGSMDGSSVMSSTSTMSQSLGVGDYVTMSNGRAMVMRNGVQSPIDNDITLSNGTVIMKDGTYKTKGGTSKTLKEGEMIDMDGKVTK
jgi:hypothetical protein